MTTRINKVKEYIKNIFDQIEDADEKRAAYIHSYGVSQCCALLALKRGLDMELAIVIGLLHDVYSYKTGATALHSQNGAEMVRVAFKYVLKDLFSEEEETIIKSAIYHHANKDYVHDEYDELLKDSDILQRLSFDNTYGWFYGQRLLRIMKELSLPMPNITILPKEKATVQLFNQSHVADIAEDLAKRKIAGEQSDLDYMKMIRYYPEESVFEGLKNAWCAAFIYHCCLEAGLLLPIRVPHTAKKVANCRFNGVGGWYEWGMENGYCYFKKDGFTPERGDIVIYNNIIPKEDKEENSAWHDHIGIVLSCDDSSLIVAEGNVGNKNVSGIVSRKCDNTIGCYIRIPKDYTYDGWKIDYKTGEEKIVKYFEEIANTPVVRNHYDSLIDEDNDSVHDPKPLKEYMDKWDGKAFIEAMQLSPDKSVFEIGVGTGRLALRICENCENCENFTGIDISPKSIERAAENLKDFANATLICTDFLDYDFAELSHGGKFDVVYSSLTFMHIKDKRKAIKIVADLLRLGGRFVLSISKHQQTEIDYGTRKIAVYPDTPEKITTLLGEAGLVIEKQFETEFAVLFIAVKGAQNK